MDGFLYDTRNELTNYTYYYQFDPYMEIQLEADEAYDKSAIQLNAVQ